MVFTTTGETDGMDKHYTQKVLGDYKGFEYRRHNPTFVVPKQGYKEHTLRYRVQNKIIHEKIKREQELYRETGDLSKELKRCMNITE